MPRVRAARVVAAMVVVVLLAGGCGRIGAGGSGGAGVPYALLADQPRGGQQSVELVTSADALAAAWRDHGLRGAAPAADFDRNVVVLLGVVATDRCPAASVTGVGSSDLGKDVTVQLRWAAADDPGRGCEGAPRPHTLVVALPRAQIGHGLVTVHLVRGGRKLVYAQSLLP
jgi:hypothetical protein